ncbi:hypothetical protein M422DRAFT_259720 [Sphaerobolus stellatus SS14]|uniref:Uncharacterized protein n=1 Tax=Sphaerobolus stellatus (strain SS14) TaxID=990650 RepID=A0A0C9USQ4_SPHS4|nr:hypothetical protein M422DRAFT_259720 [Sphaerobolus stellatus SS14]
MVISCHSPPLTGFEPNQTPSRKDTRNIDFQSSSLSPLANHEPQEESDSDSVWQHPPHPPSGLAKATGSKISSKKNKHVRVLDSDDEQENIPPQNSQPAKQLRRSTQTGTTQAKKKN